MPPKVGAAKPAAAKPAVAKPAAAKPAVAKPAAAKPAAKPVANKPASAGLTALGKGVAAKSGAANGVLAPKVGGSVKGVAAKCGAAKPGGAAKGVAAKGKPAQVDPAVLEEQKRKTEEEAVAKAAAEAAAEEARKIEAAKRNGKVEVRYNHYKEQFDIIDGKIAMKTLDDQFCLSFVFANCRLHLTDESPDRGVVGAPNIEEMGEGIENGEFLGLEVGSTYWVTVQEDNEEAKKAEERQAAFIARKNKERAEDEANAAKNLCKGEKMESCSCIEGNPCADAYCCKDWKNRFEVATKNGWKGFS